ncbi:MAG: hypothetical protein U1F42_03190 [Candidatus Competibacteraceae bacterium]
MPTPCTGAKVCCQQQDCIPIDGAIHQDSMLPITALTLAGDEVVLAVADGVASSDGNRRIAPATGQPDRAGGIGQGGSGTPGVVAGGFVANRHLRHVQTQLSDKLADDLKTYGAASTLAVAHVRGRRAAILNVGDSRVYRANREGRWWRLSKDHTILQGMIDRGDASPDAEYASVYGMLEHVLCADSEESDFAIHRVLATCWNRAIGWCCAATAFTTKSGKKCCGSYSIRRWTWRPRPRSGGMRSGRMGRRIICRWS